MATKLYRLECVDSNGRGFSIMDRLDREPDQAYIDDLNRRRAESGDILPGRTEPIVEWRVAEVFK